MELAKMILEQGVYLDRYRNPHGNREAWQIFDRKGILIAQAKARPAAIEKAIKALQAVSVKA